MSGLAVPRSEQALPARERAPAQRGELRREHVGCARAARTDRCGVQRARRGAARAEKGTGAARAGAAPRVAPPSNPRIPRAARASASMRARGELRRRSRGHVAIDEQPHAGSRAQVLEHQREARAAPRHRVDARHANRNAVSERAGRTCTRAPRSRARSRTRASRASGRAASRTRSRAGRRRRLAGELELDDEVPAVAALELDAGQPHARSTAAAARLRPARPRAAAALITLGSRDRLRCRGQPATERRTDAIGRDPARRRGDLPSEREVPGEFHRRN